MQVLDTLPEFYRTLIEAGWSAESVSLVAAAQRLLDRSVGEEEIRTERHRLQEEINALTARKEAIVRKGVYLDQAAPVAERLVAVTDELQQLKGAGGWCQLHLPGRWGESARDRYLAALSQQRALQRELQSLGIKSQRDMGWARAFWEMQRLELPRLEYRVERLEEDLQVLQRALDAFATELWRQENEDAEELWN